MTHPLGALVNDMPLVDQADEFDKTATSYQGWIDLATVLIWL